MQIMQSLTIWAQYEKHFSPSVVHFRTPPIVDRFNFTDVGDPSVIAPGGHASVQRRHDSQNSVTPNWTGESWCSGASVKIFPKRTRGPNSGVITSP